MNGCPTTTTASERGTGIVEHAADATGGDGGVPGSDAEGSDARAARDELRADGGGVDATRSGRGPSGDGSDTVESDAGADVDGSGGLPTDECFHLLQNARRRRALCYLHESETEPVDLGDLAEHVAAFENEVDPVRLTSAQRKRAYVGLYQSHLPKLDEAGVVDYDKDRGTIASTPLAAELTPYLEVGERGRPAGADGRVAAALDRRTDGLDVRAAGPAGVATTVAAVLTAGAWTSALPPIGAWLPTVMTALFALATLAAALR